MTREQAQKHAPAYLRLPDDGALYRCNDCQELHKHTDVFVTLTPDGKTNWGVTCRDCLCEHWFAKARDCGVISS